MARLLIVLLVFSTLQAPLFAQKIKYKDIYPLLKAKRYEEGAPFLSSFLQREPDHASALYHYGISFQLKVENMDLFGDPQIAKSYADSAATFLAKAKSFVDEKELRKNDEYWQEFSRRDMRTGKFGIKVSDVHLDIEQRIDKVNAYSENFSGFQTTFDLAVSSYLKAVDLYDQILTDYTGYNEFLLRGAYEEKERINAIRIAYDSFSSQYERMLESLKVLGKRAFEPEIIVLEIMAFDEKAARVPDFKHNNPEIYNFLEWTRKVNEIIDSRILPMQTSVVDEYKKLEAMGRAIAKQATIDTSSIPLTLDGDLYNLVLEFDQESILFPLFKTKIMDVRSAYLSSPHYHQQLNDSINIDEQIYQSKRVLGSLSSLDSIEMGFSKRDLGNEIANYPELLNSVFMDIEGFENEVKSLIGQLKSRRSTWKERAEFWTSRGKFAFFEGDSIPLYISSLLDSTVLEYQTRLVAKKDSLILASGWKAGNTFQGFLVAVNSSRQVIFHHQFPLKGLKEVEATDSLEVYLAPTSFDKLIYVLYWPDNPEAVNAAFNLAAASVNINGSQKWISYKSISGPIQTIEYDDLVNEIKMYYSLKDDNGFETFEYIILDGNGKWQ
jgi:hypothetical protein